MIYQNELVFAVPGFSPQVYPYILVLPQRHTSSMAKTTFYERQSLFKCLQFLIDLLQRNIGADISLYVFEHGGCSNGISKHACLEHAHYHIMVNQIGVLADFIAEKHPTPYTFDLESQVICESYLFAGVYRGGGATMDGFIIDQEAHPPERQYFRRLLARRIGDFRWNWRLGINEPYMLQLKRLVG